MRARAARATPSKNLEDTGDSQHYGTPMYLFNNKTLLTKTIHANIGSISLKEGARNRDP